MQNCRFAWLRVWWLSVIVFFLVSLLSLSLLCCDNEICLTVTMSSNMPPHFQLNIKSSILKISFFLHCRYESGQFGENSICYCLRETQQKTIESQQIEWKTNWVLLLWKALHHHITDEWWFFDHDFHHHNNRLYLKSDKKYTQNYGSIFQAIIQKPLKFWPSLQLMYVAM